MDIKFINDVLLLAVAIAVLLNSRNYSQNNWRHLNNTFQKIDIILNNRNHKENNLFHNVNFQFLLSGFLFASVTGFCYYKAIASVGILKVLPAYLHTEVGYIYEASTNFLLANLVIAIKVRYTHLNKRLELNKNFTQFDNQKDFIGYIRNTGTLARLLSEIIDCFNQLFGWVLVFTVGQSCIDILGCLNFIITNATLQNNHRYYFNIVMAIVSVTLGSMIATVVVIFSSDNLSKEREKTSQLCYKLQEMFPNSSRERKELFKLARILKDDTATITAARFFDINKGTLLGIFGTVTTYFIVIIQFRTTEFT